MNPYAAGAIRLHKYWNDLLHNLLRLATVHLAKERLDAFVETVVHDAAFSAAEARVRDSDASRRRHEMQRSRRHSDGWFFERFAAL